MRLIATSLLILALVGLVCSVVLHVAGLVGIPRFFANVAWLFLGAGILVVCPATLAVAEKFAEDFKLKDLWKAVLRGCPKWMRNVTYFFIGYAVFGLFWFMIRMPGVGGPPVAEADGPVRVFRGSLAMALYAAAVGILYSAIRVQEHDRARRCPNGHPAAPSARFCEECGEAILDESTPQHRRNLR